jgi:hypothetical protein
MLHADRNHFIDCDKECGAHDALSATVSEMRGAALAVAWIIGILGALLLSLLSYGYLSLVEQDKDFDEKLERVIHAQINIDSNQRVIQKQLEQLFTDEQPKKYSH